MCDYSVTARLLTLLSLPAAALFLEFWKRYSAEITHRWDLTGFDVKEEHPRPEYLTKLKDLRQEVRSAGLLLSTAARLCLGRLADMPCFVICILQL